MTYQTVLMDPPWLESGGGKSKRGADRHYPLLKWPDIVSAIHKCTQWAEVSECAHLYIWTTNNYLPDALNVINALGFRYVTNVVWVKEGRAGLGQYFRGRHELLLFAVRGRRPTQPRTERRDLPSVIDAPRGRHSEKPAASYELIEARSHGPRLELFARSHREGWTCWGNELEPLGGALTVVG